MLSQVIELGEFGILRLSANGAVIGRARRSDEVDYERSTVQQRPSDHLAPDVRSTASVATLRKIPSVDDQHETPYASRDYGDLKPETVMTSACSDAIRREQRLHHRSMIDIPVDQSCDTRRFPVHEDSATWQQPEPVWLQTEAVNGDDGTARRRQRPQSVEIDQSRDKRRLPVYEDSATWWQPEAVWRQPEVLNADDGTARRRQRPQSVEVNQSHDTHRLPVHEDLETWRQPEVVWLQTEAVNGYDDTARRRQRPQSVEINQSRDKRGLPVHEDSETWWQPEIVNADDGTARRRQRPQSVEVDQSRDARRLPVHQDSETWRQPEAVWWQTEAVNGDDGTARRRQGPQSVEIDQSRDKRRLPVNEDSARLWQPEVVNADDGTARRLPSPQSGESVVSSTDSKESRRRTECQRQAARDAVNSGYKDSLSRHCRLANNCDEELLYCQQIDGNDRDNNHMRPNEYRSVVADHTKTVNVPRTEQKITKPLDEQQRIGEGRQMMMQGVVVAGVTDSAAPLADCNSSSSHSVNSHTAAPRTADTHKSTPAVVATWSQIWWPFQESSVKEELKYSANDRIADKSIAVNAPAAADNSADNGDTSNATLYDINASFEESIRELDIYLQQQDSDSV